jgi:hypothetical protein
MFYTVKDRLVLSSERTPDINKPAAVRQTLNVMISLTARTKACPSIRSMWNKADAAD